MRLCILDDINKVRLCFLTQNYTNNQSEKKMLAKPINATKSTSTISESLVLPRQVN